MIRHCVFFRLEHGADLAALRDVIHGLAALVDRLDGCFGFCAGTNRDFESKSPEYPYGFTLDTQDETALAQYADHPDHKALGARLVALCDGGSKGIIVFDIEPPL